jgi:hypothetical protein
MLKQMVLLFLDSFPESMQAKSDTILPLGHDHFFTHPSRIHFPSVVLLLHVELSTNRQ